MQCHNCNRNKHEIKGQYDLKCQHIGKCLMKDTELRESYSQFCFAPGKKIRFKNEKNCWTIRICDDRWIIAIRRNNYTICDLYECIRGKEDTNKYDYIHEQLNEVIKDLDKGNLKISYRTWKLLEIEEVK